MGEIDFKILLWANNSWNNNLVIQLVLLEIISEKWRKIVFLDQNEIRRKRQRSSDDAALNVFKKSPGHDGRKLLKIVIFV